MGTAGARVPCSADILRRAHARASLTTLLELRLFGAPLRVREVGTLTLAFTAGNGLPGVLSIRTVQLIRVHVGFRCAGRRRLMLPPKMGG